MVLVLAAGVSAALTPLVMRLARALGAVDRPTARGVSRRDNMPLLGGLAVAGGFVLAVACGALWADAAPSSERLRGLLLGAGVILALGVIDDRFGMKAWPKLVGQLVAAAIAITHGYQIDRLSDPISMRVVDLPLWVIWVATPLWIVGITNALNLVDGLDGLASGVGAIIGLTLSVIAWQAGQPFGVCFGLALVGALLGFLPFNFPPARIFLGDTGALLIGFVLSLLALEGYRRVSLLTFIVPLLALAVPILDTLLSIVRRVRTRSPIFTADRLHMHHRLLAHEGSTRSAVLQFYFLTAAFCLISVSFTRLQGYAAALFLLATAVLTVRLLRNLGLLTSDPGQNPGEDPGDLHAVVEEKKP